MVLRELVEVIHHLLVFLANPGILLSLYSTLVYPWVYCHHRLLIQNRHNQYVIFLFSIITINNFFVISYSYVVLPFSLLYCCTGFIIVLALALLIFHCSDTFQFHNLCCRTYKDSTSVYKCPFAYAHTYLIIVSILPNLHYLCFLIIWGTTEGIMRYNSTPASSVLP